MRFLADLHIHSKYSRATSRDCDLEHLALWGLKKGLTVIGTGDFTHPAWFREIQDKLTPAESGLFQLKPSFVSDLNQHLPKSCQGPLRFMLSVEISTIYKKGDRVRKIHHLVFMPSMHSAARFREKLESIGNIRSDGRPILGLDSRNLLEIVLEQGGLGAFLIPAHIWTPWFSVLGSKSGFDSVEDCYGDLSPHVFAVETGLSSDPPMNWRVSSLDRYRLVSNSDAHSPSKLGREACVFDTPLDYPSILQALKTGRGYQGTLEFFPEEGKYHLDGHRECKLRLTPPETKVLSGICPICRKELTIGVLNRVEALADRRPLRGTPKGREDFSCLVPLPEVLSEILGAGPNSLTVRARYEHLLNRLGPELAILCQIPLPTLTRGGGPLLAEAVRRIRSGKLIRSAGYDGVFGTIKLFKDSEVKRRTIGQ